MAGGATGGHLFPAIALARSMLAERWGTPYFICTDRPFDRRELEAAGLPYTPVPSVGLTPGGLPRIPLVLPGAVAACLQLYRRLKPDLVAGFGGHGAVAPLLAATIRRIPYVLFEQNALPGRTTRLFARGARRIYLQWPQSRRFFGGRGIAVGSPVRSELRPVPKADARAQLGIDETAVVPAIMGGSQGARALNEAVSTALCRLDGLASRVHVVHLAGRGASELEKKYARSGIRALVMDFCRRMELVYSAADFLLCRAGALTLQEAALFAVPCVLVPLPGAADGHQAENARILAARGAALVVPQESLGTGFIRRLLLSYVSEPEGFRALGIRLSRLFPRDALEALRRDIRAWRRNPSIS